MPISRIVPKFNFRTDPEHVLFKVPDFLAGSSTTKRNYLETQAKRKMLWGKKPVEKAGELTDQQKLWANLTVGTDKQTNKFQKVLRLKDLSIVSKK